MPRKKPEGTPSAPKPNKGASLISRYLPIAVAAMAQYIIEGNETRAEKTRTEIQDQLGFVLRGVALEAVMALVNREWELAKQFASPQTVDMAFDEANLFRASRVHSHGEPEPDTSILDLEPEPYRQEDEEKRLRNVLG